MFRPGGPGGGSATPDTRAEQPVHPGALQQVCTSLMSCTFPAYLVAESRGFWGDDLKLY